MMAEDRVEDAQALQWAMSPDLLLAVARFNLCVLPPAGRVPRERLAAFLGEDALAPTSDAFWHQPTTAPLLSEAVYRRLQHGPCFDPVHAEWALALLPDAWWPVFCQHLSAALLQQRVRHTLSRDDVLRWREWLSLPAWRFALEGAALLPGLPTPPEVDLASTNALTLGADWIWRASEQWHPAIAERWRLWRVPPASVIDAAASTAQRTAMLVLSVVFPRWFSRFVR